MHLEEKCGALHEQQSVLRWTIEMQIVLDMLTMSGLLVEVCEQLTMAKVITLTDQEQTVIQRLRHLLAISHSPLPYVVSLSSQSIKIETRSFLRMTPKKH